MAEDELAEINGINPNELLQDGEETEFKSLTRKNTRPYKIKRLRDVMSCTCPAWRNQKQNVEARTCKHLRSFLGESYEDARMELKNKDGNSAAPAPKPSSTKRKRVLEDEGDDEDRSGPADEVTKEADEDGSSGDPLAKISGISPKEVIAEGEEKEVESQTSNSKYRIKRASDHYYCTCPAWRMQKDAPVNARSCKHLRSVLGDDYEDARIEMMDPGALATRVGTAANSKRGTNKKAKTEKKKIPEVLLAVKWEMDSGPDPTGWWASEKLDGVRSYFDGKQFYSRNGNTFSVPQNLIDLLPSHVTLDGELFGGRRKFNDTVSIVRSSTSPKWAQGVVTYQIFDIPSMGDSPFEDRITELKRLFRKKGPHYSNFAKVVEQTEVKDTNHVLEMLKEVEAQGGEGLMLRKPKSKYENKRSNTLLKIKTFFDAEAEVIGYEDGKGRNKGVTGALKCKMASGKTFRIGTGLSDAQRKKPPKIGAIVTYHFQELTPDGVPRFPSYAGEAIDKDEAKDADIPSHKKVAMDADVDD